MIALIKNKRPNIKKYMSSGTNKTQNIQIKNMHA